MQITSTTDSSEQVTEALGDLAKPKESEDKPSASPEQSEDETTDESETSDGTEDADAEVEASKEDDEAEESEPEEGKKKKKNGVKKRIDKLIRQNAESDARAKFWEQKALEKQTANETPKAAPVQLIDSDKLPQADDYATNADFQAALVEFKVEQKLRERDEKARVAEIKSASEKQSQTFADKLTEFAKSKDDYQEALDDVKHIPLNRFFEDQIKTSDLGPELVYQLAKHPSDYERMSKLQPVELLRALGKFEARFEKSDETSDKTKTEIKKSKAPAPINPVKAKGSGVSKSFEEMDFQEFSRAREAQLSKR